MEKINYDSLPSFLKNLNAALEESTEETKWNNGKKPDYSLVNTLYDKEKTISHPLGSLEDIMTNLVKNWEKEISHKADPGQWLTIVPEQFRMRVNGSPWKSLLEVAKVGAYNAFIGNSEYYSADHVTDPHESHQVFRKTLGKGFALEILEVYSPPPKVAFKFRHWGYMTGNLKCPGRSGNMLDISPHGGKVEMFGVTTMLLNEKFQILEMEFYFRPEALMEQLVHPPS